MIKKLERLFDNICLESSHLEPSYFRIGPTPISCSFWGNYDKTFFTNALAHLEELNEDPTSIRIIIIDEKTSDKKIPKWLWFWSEISTYDGEMKKMPEGLYGNCNTVNGILILIDYNSRRMLFWAKDIKTLPEYERSFPLRQVLFFWHSKSNNVLVHGGAVGFSTGGVLLAGKGGSGKSTATMACLDSPLFYAGDDFVLANPDDNYLYSLFNVAKLEESNFKIFPNLFPYVYNKHEMPEAKGQLFLHQFMPEKLIKGFPLKAILLPKFTGKTYTTYKVATATEAMLALAPSSTLILRTSTIQVKQIAKIVKTVPAFWLETGTDLSEIPNKIIEIIKEVS